jgi:hypothetical protein
LIKEGTKNQNLNEDWVPILRSTLAPGTRVIPSVQDVRRKRRLTDGTIHKWKARFNVDKSKQVYGVNFWKTYDSVAQRVSIRLIMYV